MIFLKIFAIIYIVSAAALLTLFLFLCLRPGFYANFQSGIDSIESEDDEDGDPVRFRADMVMFLLAIAPAVNTFALVTIVATFYQAFKTKGE